MAQAPAPDDSDDELQLLAALERDLEALQFELLVDQRIALLGGGDTEL